MRVLLIRSIFGVFGIVGVLASGQALSDSVQVEEKDQAKVSVQEPSSQSGLMMHIDPDTGETLGYRRPDPDKIREDERLRQALSRSDEGLVEVVLPDGSIRVDLQGRFRHVQAAQQAEGGMVKKICVDRLSLLSPFLDEVDRSVPATDGGQQ